MSSAYPAILMCSCIYRNTHAAILKLCRCLKVMVNRNIYVSLVFPKFCILHKLQYMHGLQVCKLYNLKDIKFYM